MEYRYNEGFAVGSLTLPDPETFSGDLQDTEAQNEEDSNGLTHRSVLKTKHTVKLSWSLLDWGTMAEIIAAVKGKSFKFSFPDVDGDTSITAWADSISWDVTRKLGDGTYVGKLSFTVNEY